MPMPLYEGVEDVPPMTVAAFQRCPVFIAERARTLRRFLSKIKHPLGIDNLHILELDKHQPGQIVSQLKVLFAQHPLVGFCSEAGTPCIADPGFRVTAWAQDQGVTVVPYPGPNSILMALMASGFSGQSFQFHGYLSAKKNELAKDLKRLESLAQKTKSPQFFIEAPYRNGQVMEQAIAHLSAKTRFHVSVDLCTSEVESITKTIEAWKKGSSMALHKRPAVFGLLG